MEDNRLYCKVTPALQIRGFRVWLCKNTGEGVLGLKGFVGALRNIGYDGPVAQEVLMPMPTEEDRKELILRTKAGFDRLFGQA